MTCVIESSVAFTRTIIVMMREKQERGFLLKILKDSRVFCNLWSWTYTKEILKKFKTCGVAPIIIVHRSFSL